MSTSPSAIQSSFTKRSDICYLLALPTELLDHILGMVKQSDDAYRRKEAHFKHQLELADAGARVDPFNVMSEEEWRKFYGVGTRALYGTCKLLREKLRPDIYEVLRLSRANELFFFTEVQFVVNKYAKTVVFDDLKESSAVDDMADFLRPFLVQLLGFKSLERLIFSSTETMLQVANLLPSSADYRILQPRAGPRRRFETLRAVSQHLAKNIKSIEFTATIPLALQLSLRFPSVTTFTFKRDTRYVELLNDITLFGQEASQLTQLNTLNLDLRVLDRLDDEDDLLRRSFFDPTSNVFPWKSSTTLTCLSFSKYTFLNHDYLFVTQFCHLRSLHLDIQHVEISTERIKIQPLPNLKDWSAAEVTEKDLPDLLGLFSDSPLTRVRVVLNPEAELRALEGFYDTLQQFNATLRSLTLSTQGWVLCPCDKDLARRSPTLNLPKATVEFNSDEIWRDIRDGIKKGSKHCCTTELYQDLMTEVQEVLEFGMQKLVACKAMDDGAGVWELSRWLVNLRARKYLEDQI